MTTSSNTMILPTASTSIGVARIQINDSFFALLQNFYSASRPSSTNITYEGAGFSPPNGTLWVDSSTGTLYKADSVYGKNASFSPFSRYGIGYRIEPNKTTLDANQSQYEIGELVSTTFQGVDSANARLYMKFSNSSPFFVDVGTPNTGSITSTMIADQSITTNKIANNSISTPKLIDGNITSPKLASGGSIFFNTAGLTGFGTSSPFARVQITGSNTVHGYSGVAAIFGTGSTSNVYLGSSGGNTPFIGSSGANPLVLSTNGTERMRILSGGNVGIGTSAPVANLQITGNTVIHGYTGVVAVFGAGTTSNLYVGSSGGNTPFIAANGANPLVLSTNGTERMRILSGGNIGIANTAPAHALTVNGTIESRTGGIRFPDGSTQTAAGITAVSKVTVGSGYFVSDVTLSISGSTLTYTVTRDIPPQPA